ncbi:hypothetical protein [Paludisphaera rhizosphaerae]|uniref:hypothetical protein n=1 Tax=Paludisphaera rhizosphaerae TaxID=2711216 RepID=UPI0013EAEA04|nr:hypothetical protein [Paludisphaera rhizosphaerae]
MVARSGRTGRSGAVVPATAPEFDAANNSFVGNPIKPDGSPDAIVRVKDEKDVVSAMNSPARTA